MQCSVLGTCLSEEDLLGAIRKGKASIHGWATSYDIHAHCVKMATSDNATSRALHKLLDKRYEGAVRLASRAETKEEILALWERLRDAGQIGAGYWAIMSHTHIPPEVMTQAFGEVHMLSHLHGRGAREMATQVAEMQHRTADIEARLRRAETARNEALAERDAARAELAVRAAAAGAASPGDSVAQPTRAAGARKEPSGKRDRVLAAARARARQAEAENARLHATVQALERAQLMEPPAPVACARFRAASTGAASSTSAVARTWFRISNPQPRHAKPSCSCTTGASRTARIASRSWSADATRWCAPSTA
jgi:hypothetical protein